MRIELEFNPKQWPRRAKWWTKGQINFLTKCRLGHRLVMSHRKRKGRSQMYCANCHYWRFSGKD